MKTKCIQASSVPELFSLIESHVKTFPSKTRFKYISCGSLSFKRYLWFICQKTKTIFEIDDDIWLDATDKNGRLVFTYLDKDWCINTPKTSYALEKVAKLLSGEKI